MRIESLLIPGQGGMKVKSGSGAFTDSLKEGDIVKAEVLSGGRGGLISVKAEGGQVFKARLDADIALSQGDKIVLEVMGRENGVVSLAIRGDAAASGDTAVRPWPGAILSDKSLEPYAFKLAELRFPVTEESARAMRDLIALNPGMSLEEAAFIVSNKLAGDPALVRAASAMINGGEKTDVMLVALLELLSRIGSPGSGDPQSDLFARLPVSENTQSGLMESLSVLIGNAGRAGADEGLGTSSLIAGSEQGNEAVVPGPGAQTPAGTGPVNDPLATLAAPGAGPDAAGVTPETASSAQAAKTIIPQGDIIMQSTNVENIHIFSEKTTLIGENPLEGAGPAQSQGVVTELVQEPGKGKSEALPVVTGEQAGGAAGSSGATVQSSGLAAASRSLAEILSGIPEFRGTPEPALEKFSNMLLRIAGDNAGTAKADNGALKAMIDSLFTRIDKDVQNAGERLRSAKEELFARLALIEETAAKAAPPVRAEIMEQTGKLMDHVRLLNNIDQFVYVQLPVYINEERKTAELYMFKRRGGKRSDPDNVNILLALDLENMGHWESLMNFRNKDVSIRMEVSGEAEKAYFSNNTVMLHELLAEAGFKLTEVNITYSSEETKPLTAWAAFDRFTGVRAGAIDFKI